MNDENPNKLKLPKIDNQTKILCFDIESNGLHGEAFAVSAIIISKDLKIHDKFMARIPITQPVDAWVNKNVIPFIQDIEITHDSYNDLCNVFWEWFVVAQESCDFVLVQNGYPVEYRFLLDCQEQDLEQRYWQHPFPILDLTSMFLQANIEQKQKVQIEQQIMKEHGFFKHHPMHDAQMTAMLAFSAFEKNT